MSAYVKGVPDDAAVFNPNQSSPTLDVSSKNGFFLSLPLLDPLAVTAMVLSLFSLLSITVLFIYFFWSLLSIRRVFLNLFDSLSAVPGLLYQKLPSLSSFLLCKDLRFPFSRHSRQDVDSCSQVRITKCSVLVHKTGSFRAVSLTVSVFLCLTKEWRSLVHVFFICVSLFNNSQNK